MTNKEIVSKLVSTYTDSIEAIATYGGQPIVDFVNTVDNFAERICKDFNESRQKYYFGVSFENTADCAKYLASYLHDLYEECQNFVDENYTVDTDGEICFIGEEDD